MSRSLRCTRLSEVAQSFHSVSQTLHSGKQPAAGGMLETRLRQRGVFYHGNCEVGDPSKIQCLLEMGCQ